MFPWTASTGGPSARSSARNVAETKSPPCRIRSAARQSSTQRAGSARAPRGRCVSERTATVAVDRQSSMSGFLIFFVFNVTVRFGFRAAVTFTLNVYLFAFANLIPLNLTPPPA